MLALVAVAFVRRGRAPRQLSRAEHLRTVGRWRYKGRLLPTETLAQHRARLAREAQARATNAPAAEPIAPSTPTAPAPRDNRGYTDRYWDDPSYASKIRSLVGTMGSAPWAFRADVASWVGALRSLAPRPSVDVILSDAQRRYGEEGSPWTPNDLPGTILAVWAEQGGD